MVLSARFIFYSFFLSIWVFIHEHSRFTGEQGKGESISLIPLYHFQLLHRHLDIIRAIAVENSTSHIAISPCQDPDSKREALVSESQSLTTKLHALVFSIHQTLRKKYHCVFWINIFFVLIYVDHPIKGGPKGFSIIYWFNLGWQRLYSM